LSELLQTADEADAEKVGADETVDANAAQAAAVPDAPPLPTVGQALNGARVAAGLSVAEVAQFLKFSPRQIEALEADDYAALPGNTIVRGFVRSYGKLLKLDVDTLLQTLDARTPSAPADVRPPENMGIASQPGVDRQFSPLLSAAIVLALAALLLALWHFLGPSTAKPATTSVTPQAAPAPAPSPAPVESIPAPAAESAVVPVAATASPAAAPAGSASAAPVMPATAGAAQLLFVFQDRCWLEVTDATKQKLHSAENPGGSRLTLSGKPPYDIVIGNATKVALTYGERTIDLAPHTRADVARLTLE
jgi:cytoskeleton protein RodZ